MPDPAVLRFPRAVTRPRGAWCCGRPDDFAQRPDAVVVEFGVELSAQAGAVITAAGASAQLHVSLTWNKS
ncbi:CU044_2847 family protein [Streptomyces sp. NPDC014864]|uniref:CU044_2847 family protein n=1 Tax=Streptomyces sp. NPDC014864 TaxID=3364924 RepID=UPI0036FC241F